MTFAKKSVIVFASLSYATLNTSSAATFMSLDLIDDFFNSGTGIYTGSGRYDLFNANDGTLSADGEDDLEIRISNSGVTSNDGNGVEWTANNLVNGTGLRSEISATGTPSTNNSGYRVIQVIEIRFLTMEVLSENIADVSWSSGNTAGVAWEFSMMEFLDESFNPFSSTPTIDSYLNHTPINGVAGLGTIVADSRSTLTGVGSNQVTSGSNGSLDFISASEPDTPLDTGLAAGVMIGGVRFTHVLEDVRGISNGNTSFSNTINDFEITAFDVNLVPEPSSLFLLGLGGLGFLRRRRTSGN